MASTSLASAPLSSLEEKQSWFNGAHLFNTFICHQFYHLNMMHHTAKLPKIKRGKQSWIDPWLTGLSVWRQLKCMSFCAPVCPVWPCPWRCSMGHPSCGKELAGKRRARKRTTEGNVSRSSTGIFKKSVVLFFIINKKGLCSGLKSSYVLIHIENSGEEIQTSLPETT